jgi:hypothetical protein
MSENLLRTLRRDAGLRQQRPGEVTHIVKARRREPCPAQRPSQDVSQQLVGLDRPALVMIWRAVLEALLSATLAAVTPHARSRAT